MVLLSLGLLVAACGSAGDLGRITGTVSASAALAVVGTPSAVQGPARPARGGSLRRPPLGAPQHVPDELLVRFKAGAASQAAEVHRLAGAAEVRRLLKSEIRLVRLPPGTSMAEAQARYRADPRVAYAEPNYYRYPDAAMPGAVTPNDPRYPDQWNLARVNAAAAWEVARGSSVVIVAVVDWGVLPHEDLRGVFVAGRDFVDGTDNTAPRCASSEGHGTGVAGIIAAVTDNGVGVAGMTWGGPGSTRIMPLLIYDGTCATTSARIVEAIEWAADHSARVINMSLGGGVGEPFSQAEQDAVTYAHRLGVVLVASAGNHGREICTSPQTARWPVGYDHVIGVAATTATDTRASYSNVGPCIDLAAPGGEEGAGVLTTSGTVSSPSQYAPMVGTSFAAPHVAGLAALLMAKGVTGPEAIEAAMKRTATPLGAGLGAGLINAGAAMGASAATNPMRVFGGTVSGTAIARASAMVPVASTGMFALTIAAGTWTVLAWQDGNGSGIVDAGDLFGSAPGITVTAGATTAGVIVAVTEVPPGTPPRTLTGGAP